MNDAAHSYNDASFENEEEGPTAIELAQKIINELESDDTLSLEALKEKIDAMKASNDMNINYVEGIDLLPDNTRDGKTLVSQYEWNTSTTIPEIKTERDVSILNRPRDHENEIDYETSMPGDSSTKLQWNNSIVINRGEQPSIEDLNTSEEQKIPGHKPFKPDTSKGILSANSNYGRTWKVSPPKYVSSNRYSPRPRHRGRRHRRPKTSGQVESIVRKQIRTTPVQIRRNNNSKRGKSAARSRSPRSRPSPLAKSIQASLRIYSGSAKTARANHTKFKLQKARRFDKFNHDGFVYYSKKNLTT